MSWPAWNENRNLAIEAVILVESAGCFGGMDSIEEITTSCADYSDFTLASLTSLCRNCSLLKSPVAGHLGTFAQL